MRVVNEATYVDSFMFLGSLMFLDFHGGDCSDLPGFWHCSLLGRILKLQRNCCDWLPSVLKHYFQVDTEVISMIMQDIWELYWQNSGACSPLIGKYEVYCLHVCFCIICEICAVLNWSLDCARRWYGKQARNETACDDHTAVHLQSPLLSAVSNTEVCLRWGQAYILLIAVYMGVWVKSMSGFWNWYVRKRETNSREYMEVFWSVPAFYSQLLHFHGQIAVSCVWSDQLVLFIQNLWYMMLTLAGLAAHLWLLWICCGTLNVTIELLVHSLMEQFLK